MNAFQQHLGGICERNGIGTHGIGGIAENFILSQHTADSI